MQPLRFRGRIRYWNPEKQGGLAVVDVPASDTAAFGGLKQVHVSGAINGAEFASNVMPAGGGRLALGISKAMMAAGRAGVGDEVEIEVTAVGRE